MINIFLLFINKLKKKINMPQFIGLGDFNKYLLLILGSTIFEICINLLNGLSIQDYIMYRIVSVSGGQTVISKHILVKGLYKCFGYGLIGFIFYYIYRNRLKQYGQERKEKIGNKSRSETSSSSSIKLLYTDILKEKGKDSLINLILISLSILIYQIIQEYLNTKEKHPFNFWMLEIFFLAFFSQKCNLNYYKHQIVCFIIITFSFLFKFLFLFFKKCDYKDNCIDKKDCETSDNPLICFTERQNCLYFKKACASSFNVIDNKEDIKIYSIYLFGIIPCYLISLICHAYASVKIKQLIDKKYISPFKIIFFIGFFCFFIYIIIITLTSIFSCGKLNSNNEKDNLNIENFDEFTNYYLCINQENTLDQNNSSITYYFDSIILYVKELINPGDFKINPTIYDSIKELICTFFYIIFNFLKFLFDIYIIKNLGIFHPLLTYALYDLFLQLFIIIWKKINYVYDGKNSINEIDHHQKIQFFSSFTSDIICILAYLIFIELIELKFKGFDHDISKNIILRSKIEYINKINEDEDSDDEERYSFSDEERRSSTFNEEENIELRHD